MPRSPAKKKKSRASPKTRARPVIGIDLGGTKVSAAVVDASGRILAERKAATDLTGGWPGAKKQIIALCRELIAEQGPVAGVGIGSAGPLHAPSGRLLDPTNFGWSTSNPVVPIARELKAALKLPVTLENDAAAAALGEAWKGGAGADSVCITLGTGVGVGVIIGGKLLRGGGENHPEAGHLLLRPEDHSTLCGCGNYGCAEALLGGMNFNRRAGERLKRPGLNGQQLGELARNGDPAALALFDEYGSVLAEFLCNLVVLFYPKQIVLTGSVANSSTYFLPRAEARLRSLLERRLKTMAILPRVRVSKLGNRAGILGAAKLAYKPVGK